MPTPLSADRLAALPRIRHGFFTRHGGVSQGCYASLNCGLGSKDDPVAVTENRVRVARFLTAESLITAHQVHSATAVVVERGWSLEARPRADAIVTATRGLALGVLTADCAPVLFADAQAGVVGAAHAGWRGALSGVLEATLAAMETLGARRPRIEAAVGPCITRPAYEVGFEFKQAFLAGDAASAQFFARPDGDQRARPHFDLPGYVLYRLARAGLSPGAPPPCTYAGQEDFFSYRRSQARNEADYGRQISAIVLT
jgi:purine-nucleoside/S-methyl-5'-thioadenosine phosphorylase / adenosine deaminase